MEPFGELSLRQSLNWNYEDNGDEYLELESVHVICTGKDSFD